MSTKAIGTLGTIDLISIAGRQFTDLSSTTGVKVLAWGSSAGASNCTPRLPGTASGYQVPGGKTYQLWVVTVQTNAGGSRDMKIAYCDNDVGWETSTGPTNAVYLGAQSTAVFSFPSGSSPSNQQFFYRFDVPTGKYLFINGATTGDSMSGFMIGYEV